MTDLDAVLAGAATKTSKKKKSDIPTLEVKGDIAKAVDKFCGIKATMETAKAKLALAQDDIVPAALEFHTKEIKKAGSLMKTIKLVTENNSVQVDVAKNQYSAINADLEEDLKEQFGTDYDQMFEKKMAIKLTEAAILDREILVKLIKAVGQENFADYFEVTHVISPKERFHNDRFLKDDDRITDVLSEQKVKPYKVALRG